LPSKYQYKCTIAGVEIIEIFSDKLPQLTSSRMSKNFVLRFVKENHGTMAVVTKGVLTLLAGSILKEKK